MKRLTAMALAFAFSATLILSFTASARAQTVDTGTLSDGATFLSEVPANWNGTLWLYSHGYVIPGAPNPAQDVGDPATRAFLLANGYALDDGFEFFNNRW